MTKPFRNRTEAGRILARRLVGYAHRADVIVLALPRGGVSVGYEVATALQLPLGVFIARKLGVPGREELAMGAIASGGAVVLNGEVVEDFGIPGQIIDALAARELLEVERRERIYWDHRPPADLAGRTILLVDDAVATGATMRAAILGLRQLEVGLIVAAVPAAAMSTMEEMQPDVDDFIALKTSERPTGVKQWYTNFSPTPDDDELRRLSKFAGRFTLPITL